MRSPLLVVAGSIVAVAAAVLAAGDYVRYIATLWFVFALSAKGLQIAIGLGRIYSFGHGAFMLIGAYATGLGALHGVPIPLAIVLGMVVAAVVGAVLALPSLRLSEFALAIVTMSAATVLFQGVKAFKWSGGAQGIYMPQVPFVKLAEGRPFFLCVAAVLLLGAVISHFAERGSIGRSLRAAAANPLMAQAFGINLLKVRTAAFVLSAAYAAAAGGLMALLTGYVAPEAFTPELSIQMFAAVMIGGSAASWGPILGALFIVLIPELTQSVQNAGAIVYAALFILVVTLCPGGFVQMFSAVAAALRAWRLGSARWTEGRKSR
jgi:branched-chain amino acid transport system permease protein